MSHEELVFEGCNFFRLRLVYSILSGRPVTIRNIRSEDSAPGISNYESKLISLLEKLCNGTKVEINQTGTQVRFRPGMISGGVVNFDCGTQKCISYFLEPVILLSPFCKTPVVVKLKGITNHPGELSVNAMKACWLKVYNKFVLNDEKLDLKIIARGFAPDGGGTVIFTAPIVKTLRPVQRTTVGKICKIRGQAYVSKVSPSLAYRMVDEAKKALHGFISDVFITVDQRKGDSGGNSPGYGLILTAETTEGVFYHGEAMSQPKGASGDPLVPEDIGHMAATRLMEQIYRGGAVDGSAQVLASTFMALGQKDVSTFIFGPLAIYGIHVLRHLKQFFEIEFKLEDAKTIGKMKGEVRQGGSQEGVLLKAMGMSGKMAAIKVVKGKEKKQDENEKPEIHWIPCKAEFTGPANVDAYLIREKSNSNDGAEKSSLRGRDIEGENVKIPEGYEIVVLNNKGRDVYVIEDERKEVMSWEWDRSTGDKTTIRRAFNYIKMAEALASDD
ncbi:hypothetical protein WR25_07479 [Diploscapter pachys]|uniref:RNA 3'-terminal phosphate cyclase domain-containing protein n=1 Tax=Diploscapter pachys TaxID=2018661 RepID=A0A2A2LRP2_9BILA|nr:hypothetical protein WR25_07479 [Diploscapter pachys]